MMFFSAHYSDREPYYFSASSWRVAAEHGTTQGTMITLYWLADEQRPQVARAEAELATSEA